MAGALRLSPRGRRTYVGLTPTGGVTARRTDVGGAPKRGTPKKGAPKKETPKKEEETKGGTRSPS